MSAMYALAGAATPVAAAMVLPVVGRFRKARRAAAEAAGEVAAAQMRDYVPDPPAPLSNGEVAVVADLDTDTATVAFPRFVRGLLADLAHQIYLTGGYLTQAVDDVGWAVELMFQPGRAGAASMDVADRLAAVHRGHDGLDMLYGAIDPPEVRMTRGEAEFLIHALTAAFPPDPQPVDAAGPVDEVLVGGGDQ